MLGIFNFILWTVFIYYLFSFCARLLLPILLKFFFKRMTKKFNNKSDTSNKHSDYTERNEGDTTVRYKKDKRVDPGGEYVEYEELDED